MVAEKRTQRFFDGQNEDSWLCPSHPANQDAEVAAMIELAERFPVDGILFDFIRYPHRYACFCDGCRERFEARLGRKLANWPQDVRNVPDVAREWATFRRDNISSVVRRTAEAVHKLDRKVEISAAVLRSAEVDAWQVAQDWRQWCREGWVDFVCPMDYIESSMMFRSAVASQKQDVGRTRLYPIIGVSCWQNPRDAINLVEQIKAVRETGLDGFIIFNYDVRIEKALPLLHLGLTR